jgi:hypothetical protein
MSQKEHWKTDPDAHDYPAAQDYLTLVMSPAAAAGLVEALKNAPLFHRAAKDLLRASGLALLPESNFHVAKDLNKVKKGQLLSPVLLVAGDASRGAHLTIADGYHRICASWYLNEDETIPCRLVDLP